MQKDAFFSSVFPLGSHLCREPMPPMSELKHDMELLKKNGFNLVKLQEHWMVDEPLEGLIDLSKYEELIDHAAKLDLGVYLGLTCEQAPGWLYAKYPDCRMVGRNGQTILYEAQTTLPADGKPGPCFDHPGAMEEQLRFIRTVVGTLGKYPNLVVWNTWQEIAYWPIMTAGQEVCFCGNTLAFFRAWLAEKYRDLDGLNRAWNTRYGDWQYVQPDRGAYGQNGLPQDIDWRYFMTNIQITQILRRRAQAIRESDPLQRPVFAHKGGITPGSAHDWSYARAQDFLGSSCYPAWSPFHAWDDGAPQRGERPDRHAALSSEMASGVALTFDHIRSCNLPGKPLWAAEFQGGPVSTFLHKGRVPSPEDIRRWMLTAVGAGVTGISFWVTRAEIMAQETNGFSLLDSTGETTARMREAARVGAALNRHPALFGQPGWGGAEVGILVDEENAQVCSTVPPATEHLAYSMRGWHRLLWELGIPADFVDIEELGEETLSRYRVLILPFPLALSEAHAQAVGSFVYGGGGLISESPAGRLDEHGTARRGEISSVLSNLFGAKPLNLQMVREPGEEQRWMPVERTWGEFLEACKVEGAGPLDGVATQANLYVQTYELGGSQPVFMCNGRAAGTFRVGIKGWAWLIGTLVGHNATAYAGGEAGELARRLLELCGVKPLHAGKLLLRKRAAPGKQAWFLTNPTDAPVTETVDTGSAQVEDLLGEAFEQNAAGVQLTVAPLDVRVLVLHDISPNPKGLEDL